MKSVWTSLDNYKWNEYPGIWFLDAYLHTEHDCITLKEHVVKYSNKNIFTVTNKGKDIVISFFLNV